MSSLNLLKAFSLVFFFSSCQANGQKEQDLSQDTTVSVNSSINLENRESFPLPEELSEISGHTFIDGNDDVVYCIQDEDGDIFAFNLKTRKIDRIIPFAKAGDYEGITNDGNFFYVLKSNGSIYSLPIDSKLQDLKEFKGIVGKGEYESIGIDKVTGSLVVLCKSCKVDGKKDQLTGYILNLNKDGDVAFDKSFVIDLNEASRFYHKFPRVFNPSAITKKISTNEWFILSSIDKLILVTDSAFNLVNVLPFSRKLYEQPEGIAFDSNENLYISSEKGDGKSGMLYKIK